MRHRAFIGLVISLQLLSACATTQSSSQAPNHAAAQHTFKEALQNVEKGNFQRALELFDSTISAQPGFADAHNNKANVLMTSKQYSKAILSYSDAIRLEPKRSAYLFNRAYAYLLSGDKNASLKDFNQGLQIEPNNSKALALRGQIRMQLADYLGAISDFDQAIKLLPQNGGLYANRGVAHAKAGHLDAAKSDFSRAEIAFRNAGDRASLAKLTTTQQALLNTPAQGQ